MRVQLTFYRPLADANQGMETKSVIGLYRASHYITTAMSTRILFFLCTGLLFIRTTVVTASSEPITGADTVFEQHNRILLLFPILKVETNTPRPPIMDFVELELAADLDHELYSYLSSLSDDSLRVISNDVRNSTLYKNILPVDIAPEKACKLLQPDALFTVRYHFINMPTLYSNEQSIASQLSELRAEFAIYDCQSGNTVWKANHVEYVPTPTAAYNDLMKKMYKYLEEILPYQKNNKSAGIN